MDRHASQRGKREGGIPHPRGDGPNNHFYFPVHLGYSPPPWGWTAHFDKLVECFRVFPTPVGMDRMTSRSLTLGSRIPHPRGDGPLLEPIGMTILEYSPPPWGWTEIPKIGPPSWNVFPTPVGMDRGPLMDDHASFSIPHPRGDGPLLGFSFQDCIAYSPPPWGWTVHLCDECKTALVFPTPVGMDRWRFPPPASVVSIPHPRGDELIRRFGDRRSLGGGGDSRKGLCGNFLSRGRINRSFGACLQFN